MMRMKQLISFCLAIIMWLFWCHQYFGECKISCRTLKAFLCFGLQPIIIDFNFSLLVLTRLSSWLLPLSCLRTNCLDVLKWMIEVNLISHNLFDVHCLFLFVSLQKRIGRTPNSLLSPPLTSLTVNPSRHLPRWALYKSLIYLSWSRNSTCNIWNIWQFLTSLTCQSWLLT